MVQGGVPVPASMSIEITPSFPKHDGSFELTSKMNAGKILTSS